jgi:cytochrome c peroxidase
MNLLLSKSFFWDGRANSRKNRRGAIENPLEMNLPVHEALNRFKE